MHRVRSVPIQSIHCTKTYRNSSSVGTIGRRASVWLCASDACLVVNSAFPLHSTTMCYVSTVKLVPRLTYMCWRRRFLSRVYRRLQAEVIQLIRVVIQNVLDSTDSLTNGQVLVLHHLSEDLLQSFSALDIGQPICFRLEVAIRTPEDLGRRGELQGLTNNGLLAAPRHHWEHLTDVQVHVGVDSRKVASLLRVRVRRV
jgi:hypothetical protein